MSFPIHDRGQRSNLELRAKPYFVRLSDGIHIGYRKGKGISRWVIRRYNGKTYRMRTLAGIYPDDDQPADGRRFLSFQQVVTKIMSDDVKIPVRCSFCGKGSKEVAKLIAGPSIFICNECVALCQLYLDYPDNTGKLVVDKEFKPVLKDGKPTFAPMTDEDKKFMGRFDFG